MDDSKPKLTLTCMKEFYTFVIALAVIGAVLYACLALILDKNGDASLRGQAFGGLMGLGGIALGYFFSTNKASSDKDKVIADALKTAQPASDVLTQKATIAAEKVAETADKVAADLASKKPDV